LEALQYGVPPHGGIAIGFDRLIMNLTGAESLREVIAFPKVKDGSCPMTDAPSAVDPAQLEELHINIKHE
jgi:aspartyl-tRNA synthetase